MDGEVKGCCALLKIGPHDYEVGKMTVTQSAQRLGMGRALIEHAIKQARSLNATRLYLETNKNLTPAVRLYESIGFQHLPKDRVVPSPYARANVYMELFLG